MNIKHKLNILTYPYFLGAHCDTTIGVLTINVLYFFFHSGYILAHLFVFILLWVLYHPSYCSGFNRNDGVIIGYLAVFALVCDVAYVLPFDLLSYFMRPEGTLESLEPPAFLFLGALLLYAGIFMRKARPGWLYVACGLLFVWFCLHEVSFGAEHPAFNNPGPVRQAFIEARPKVDLDSLSTLGLYVLAVWQLVTTAFKLLIIAILFDPDLGLGRAWRVRPFLKNMINRYYENRSGKFILASRLLTLGYLVVGFIMLPASTGHLDNEVIQVAFLMLSGAYILWILYPALRQKNIIESTFVSTRWKTLILRAGVLLWAFCFLGYTFAPSLFGIRAQFVKPENSPYDCAEKVNVHVLHVYRLGPWIEIKGFVDYSNKKKDSLDNLRLAYMLSDKQGEQYSEGQFAIYMGTPEHPQPLSDDGQYFSYRVRTDIKFTQASLQVAFCQGPELVD